MHILRIASLLFLVGFVSACSSPQSAMRNATDGATGEQSTATFMPNAKINAITVSVPRSLSVSEKNSYIPRADIVWRGDQFGDRYAQVEAIVQKSANRLAAQLDGARPVNMHIEVTRFHGLSEKARYSFGGVHNINMIVTLTDPLTGAVLRGPSHVVTNLDAFGGDEAIEADKRGETQKVRVTNFLQQALYAELTQPGGYVDGNSGVFVAMNRQR